MKKPATRNDVAKAAGVSPGVVSFVLNNSNYVSEEKRKAVLEAIERLNYVPNQLARGLRMNRSGHIAFVADSFINDWLAELESILSRQSYYVSLNYTRDDDSFVDMLTHRQYECILMMSNSLSTGQLNRIAESGIPVILFRTRNYGPLHPRIVTVAPDYYDGVRKSADYLAVKGHTRIALIPPIRYKTKGITGDDFRVRAYVESLKKNDLPIEAAYVCTETETTETVLHSVREMLTVPDASRRPTAFVVGTDFLAAQVIQSIKRLGLRVPEDVAVIGADNTAFASLMSPTLTSIDFSKTEFAHKVADKMIRLMNGETPEGEYLKVSLVIRESA